MHYKKFLISGSLIFSLNLTFATQNIMITGGQAAGAPKLAIVNFKKDDGTINQEITEDFKITGEFNVVNYLDNSNLESNIQYIIQGEVIKDPLSGQVNLKYQLINHKDNSQLLNQTANFNEQYQRKAVHAIDNNIYQKITNTPGIFLSKIAAVVKDHSHYKIIVSDFDGYNQHSVLTSKAAIQSVAWDSTGNYLSYVTYESNKPVVWVQNLIQGKRYIVANFFGSNSSPTFLPNSQQLLVTLSKDDDNSHIYKLNYKLNNNAKPNQLNSSAIPLINFGPHIDTEADISAKGQIVFTSDHDGGPQIFLTDLNGKAPIRLTNNLGNWNTTARFSNDGTKITFINRNNGTLQTYVLDLTTKSTYPISQGTGGDMSPSFAPNDKLILYSSNNKLYISNITGSIQTKLNNFDYSLIIDQRWDHAFN